MGLFKQMKDMKQMVSAAPDLVEQAMKMAGDAGQLQAQAAQAAQYQAAAAGQLPAADGSLDPISGVDLRTYATVIKGIAAYQYDQSKLPGIAASHGIPADAWQAAHDGWNARIQNEPAVAGAFSRLYQEV